MARSHEVRFQIDSAESRVPVTASDASPAPPIADAPSGGSQNGPSRGKGGRTKQLRFELSGMEDVERNPTKKDVEKDLNKVFFRGARSTRFQQPRMSLLGKPINYRAHKRDMRYRKLQSRIYNFLERPKDWRSISYHLLVFMMVFMCLVLSVFATIPIFEGITGYMLYFMEIVMVIWFFVEYILRVWSAGCRSRYQELSGRLKFVRRPLCIVDLVVISASIVILCIGSSGQVFATSALRGLRFFQILRMVRVDRRGGSWKLLGSVVWAHRQELFTTLYIGFLALIFSSFLVFLAEKDKNPTKFGTYADALWWGVITLCTVGYGDSVPITWAGKLIAAFCAICGISFFALPAGILGSGFALKVQQQQRQKHLIRRRVPAANLIQCLWRCYAADENSMSVATWKMHLKPCPSPQSDKVQPRQLPFFTENRFKHNASFRSRFSTRRKERSTMSPMIPARHSTVRRTNSSQVDEKEKEQEANGDNTLNRSHLSLAMGDHMPLAKENSVTSVKKESKESEDDPDETERITTLTEVHKKAIRAIRKIRYFVARKKFKEALRPYDVKDVIEQYSAGHLDMLTRIKNLQGRIDLILGKPGSKKPDVYESKICLASRVVKVERQVDDIENKLDMLIDMYKEDRRWLVQQQQNMLTHIQQQDEPSPSPEEPGPQYPNLKLTPAGPPPKFPPNNIRLRSILVDKQQSEPNTPICRNPNKPMCRNLSDLGPRIKKRVTYRCTSQSDIHSAGDSPRLRSPPPPEISLPKHEVIREQTTGGESPPLRGDSPPLRGDSPLHRSYFLDTALPEGQRAAPYHTPDDNSNNAHQSSDLAPIHSHIRSTNHSPVHSRSANHSPLHSNGSYCKYNATDGLCDSFNSTLSVNQRDGASDDDSLSEAEPMSHKSEMAYLLAQGGSLSGCDIDDDDSSELCDSSLESQAFLDKLGKRRHRVQTDHL